jgi:MucR family transcriptional regulator, transcriptional regulator of exopolysaccharide biosynthesis
MTEDILSLTAQIVSAHVTKNAVEVGELPTLIREVFTTLSKLGEGPATPTTYAAAPPASPDTASPAVPATRSVFASYIICMECGKKMTMLKRHLMTEHGLTIDQYRSKYNLPGTYPMVAPDYAQTRSSLAKEMGLGKSRLPGSKRGTRRK